MRLSQALEDYLKVIYVLEADGEKATTTAIAQALDVSNASVTNMFKKLAGMKLIVHESYKGAVLSPAGKKVALEILRHHRLLELYLKEVMGYSWDEVHDEAEKLEHHISEQFEDRIAELLDHPTYDPHGDPIPTKDGIMPEKATLALNEAEIKTLYMVGRVRDQNPELLRYLEQQGVLPGVELTIIEKAPFDGPISLEIDSEVISLGFSIAQNIFLIRPSRQ
ncbi:MAG: metal-dependent transcriptional regulator [Bacteroidota bacterium]|nr:metal-dependent transcriptional regulator [Bacteroidota bacterium]